MKKLLITATLAAAALGSTVLLAAPATQGNRHEGHSEADCAMTLEPGKTAAFRRDERHAQMQKRMEQMHARVAATEAKEEHQH